METDYKKKFLENALTNSFVDDYIAYKKTMDFINRDFKESNINYQYNYDQFCIDFLNESLNNLEMINIFNAEKYSQFFLNFLNFNLYNLQSMINKKIKELGYKYEDFYESNTNKKINNKFLEN